ncbi:GNAT family N-acetyltransferase [Flavobacterium sp. NST-5]|uniref:GNAT family N-acetyltransferase n=1 Tax=Flavobacterium ichthyis TaxID=2698827 RepID=A0ABW9ZEQ4_9FLAO|nr:GNAT family N-acetyltransferase [Flavobacterium ichthyis]NBL65742.1 GNAT family N-acetyltransferase [Flavobacterium ichthyis]
MLNWKIKRFNELSLLELQSIYQLRSEVFVVEQNCVYQDVDGKDPKAIHVFATFEGEVVAYCRIFKPRDYFDQASIGRVVVKEIFRSKKWGHDLMKQAISAVLEYFGESQITISAQLYLKKFYESHGFVQVSEEYLEDDIPHIRMEKN